jgi:3-oxoacyl-[acyl-carrier protein] reductase
MFRLDGRVAVITGAASGIGAATAVLFAQAGADVVLADYPSDGHDVEAVRSGVVAAGRRAMVVEVDVRSTEQVDRLVGRALEAFGRVDVVVANAAIARLNPSASLGDRDWADTLDVNLTGVWRTFRAAIPTMAAAGYGRLLATTSTVGTFEAWEAHAHYSAAKAGISGMVRTLGAELGPDGITVNAVAPGIIETPQTLDSVNSLGPDGVAATAARLPVRRVGQPDDIAGAFLYLACERTSFVTGQVLVVDGGQLLVRG